MASAISMRGAMFWMTFDGTMNSALFTEFLDLLIHDIDGKIFPSSWTNVMNITHLKKPANG